MPEPVFDQQERLGLYTQRIEAFRSSLAAELLFSRTLAHPELGSVIRWVPTEWALSLANPTPRDATNTAGADSLPDRDVDMDTLFQNLVEHGMRDPLVIGVGLNGCVRLESGNQRVYCFSERGIEFIPVVGYVNDTAVTHEANGLHEGRPMRTDIDVLISHYQNYAPISELVGDAPSFAI